MRRGLWLGLLALLVQTMAMAQPRLRGENWEVVYRAGQGAELRVAGVLLGRGSWLQFAEPDWTRGYFSSSSLAPRVEASEDQIVLIHALDAQYGRAVETLRRVDAQTLEWQIEVEWQSELPAIVEWSVGIWNVGLLSGASLSADHALPYSVVSMDAPSLPGDRLHQGRRFGVDARFGRVQIEALDTEIIVFDGRASRRAWSREFPAFWLGTTGYPVPRNQTLRARYRFRIEPKPLPTEHPSVSLSARPTSVADFWRPSPSEPVLLPIPKVIWRTENTEPLRLPANQGVRIELENEQYRPAGEVVARALERYGVRAELNLTPPAPLSRSFGRGREPDSPLPLGEGLGVRAETPLSHSVGEGLGVRAETPLSHSVGEGPGVRVLILGEPETHRQYPVPDIPGAYFLKVDSSGITIVGRGVEGAFYGAQTLAQLFQPTEGALLVNPIRIVDYPTLHWRGVHLFGSTQPDFLPRLIQNVIAPAKFNHLIIECGYGQWETIRPAWVDISAPKPILREAVQTARAHLLEPIPLIQSLGHMYWAFRNNANLELAEDPETPWAISPRRPLTRPFLQRLYDEVFEVFQPRHFHVGLDEVALRGRFPFRPESQGATKAELFTEHAEWLHQELKGRGIEKVLMWGDALLAPGEANDGGAQARSPEEARYVRERLSKLPDLVIADWHYTPAEPEGYISLRVLQEAGFREIIATTWYDPKNIYTFARGAQLRRITGLLQSTWAGYSLNENTLRGQEFRQFIAYLLAGLYAWDPNAPEPDQLPFDVEAVFHDWYRREPIPLQPKAGFTVDLSSLANHTLSDWHSVFQRVPVGSVSIGGYRYAIAGEPNAPKGVMMAGYLVPDSADRYPRQITIPIERAVQNLYLLATTAYPVESGVEVADLTIEYADGTESTMALTYGVQLRAWNDSGYAFEGRPLWSGRIDTGWARLRQIHWQNPYPDKSVRAVRLNLSDRTASFVLVGLSGD